MLPRLHPHSPSKHQVVQDLLRLALGQADAHGDDLGIGPGVPLGRGSPDGC
jgi:hypothetical protein